jgi:hypothetical protein
MLRMQTVFAECPSKCKLKYSLRISLFNWSSDGYQVLVQQPGGQPAVCEVIDDSIVVPRTDGPGVWRFNVIVKSKDEPDNVADALTIETVIFPEMQKAAQEAVEKCVGAMNLIIIQDGSVASGKTDVSADAARLLSGFGEIAALEILRRLAIHRGDQNDSVRCLYLLESIINRSSAKWLTPFALPVVTDVASGSSKLFASSQAFRLIKNIPAPTNDKWIYLMRFSIEVPTYNLDNVIYELQACTPIEYRTQTAAMIVDLCSSRIHSRRAAARLCAMFDYAASAPIVMDWLQTDTCSLEDACKVFRMADYRASIAYLRKLITKPGYNHGDEEIVYLLADWVDTDSLPLLLSKLGAFDGYSSERAAEKLVVMFGSNVIPQLKEIQSRIGAEKAKHIGLVLEKYKEL